MVDAIMERKVKAVVDKRVEALYEYELLDTLPEKEFDDIVELASVFFHAPISLITLLDSTRQWFKAQIGIGGSETTLEHAFCYHAIQRPNEVMVVPDSLEDDRFRENPYATGEPHVRFYAGAPLVTDEGYALGTLCVIDREPRQFTEEQERVLRILANKVIERFEARRNRLKAAKALAEANAKTEEVLNRLLEAERLAGIGNWYVDYEKEEIYWSPEMYRIFGIAEGADIKLDIWRKLFDAKDLAMLTEVRNSLKPGEPGSAFEVKIKTASGIQKWLSFTLQFSDKNQLVGTALDITERKIAEQRKEQYTDALETTIFALSHKVRKPTANIIGLADVLGKQDLDTKGHKEGLAFLKDAADELDGYIREMNDFIRQHQKDLK